MSRVSGMNQLARCKPYLGTFVEVSLAGDYSDDELIEFSQQAYAAIEAVDRAMSFHCADSELSLINQWAFRQCVDVSKPMQDVLACALDLSARTEGVFDVSVAPQLVKSGLLPDHRFSELNQGCWRHIELSNGSVRFHEPLLIDLGGIAKGYAVDCVFSVLDAPELTVVVNAGGDLRHSHWRGEKVAIRHPSQPNQLLSLPMENQALATSGHYFLGGSSDKIHDENVRAIVPRRMDAAGGCDSTLRAFEGSVSVFAETCMMADALTKIAMLSASPDDAVTQLGGKLLMLPLTT